MSGQQQSVGLTMAFQKLFAGLSREHRIVIKIWTPLGMGQLDRAVHHIARHHCVTTPRGDIYADMASTKANSRLSKSQSRRC